MSNIYTTVNNSTLSTIQATPNYNFTNGTITTGATITTGSSWNGTYTVTPSTNFHSSNQKPILTIPHGEEKVVLEKNAALEVKGKVVINGVDLEERLKTIEKVLMIPERDVILENSYPLLKQKYEDYINSLSKYRMWESLKGEKE